MTTPVIDDGDLRKYRTELPNLIDDLGLSPQAYRLYGHLKRVAGDKGYCDQSARVMATHCKMSPASVINGKKELLENGLIVVEPGDKKKSIPDTIRIVDIWERNFRNFRERRKAAPCSPIKHPVHEPCSPNEQGVHLLNNKKEPKEEITDKEVVAQPPAKPYFKKNPLLNEGAVIVYRDICHLTPNALKCQKIVAEVQDLVLWKAVCEKFMLEGRPPQRVDWLLERYTKARGQPQVESKEEKQARLKRQYEERAKNGRDTTRLSS